MWEDVFGIFMDDELEESDSDVNDEEYNKTIINVLEQLENDIEHNKKIIVENFNIDYVDDYGQSVLHKFVNNHYDETKLLFAIGALLELGLNPNLTDNKGNNFIQNAIETGYSQDFILSIIYSSLKKGLNVNHRNNDANTIIHTAIFSSNYTGKIIPLYKAIEDYGFDVKIKNNNGKDIYEALRTNDGNTIPDKGPMLYLLISKSISRKFQKRNENNINQEDYNWLNKYGSFTCDKVDLTYNWINCNNELINTDNIDIICSKQGVGKTTYLNILMNELINNGNMVYLTSYDKLLSNCNRIGNFYSIFYKIMRKCVKNDLILLFDDLDKIYRENLDDEEVEEINSFIEMYTTIKKLKLIATTDIDYKDFIANYTLNHNINFNYIIDPDISIINNYVNNIISKYNIDSNINTILKELLIYITNENNRNEEYKNISNIKIISELIEDIINFNNNNIIDINSIIYGINMCNYIKINSKLYILEELNNYKNINIPNIRKKEK